MTNVIPVDFGSDARDFHRKLDRLTTMLEQHDEAIRRDPKKFLEPAYLEIHRLREGIKEALELWRPKVTIPIERGSMPPRVEIETMRVLKQDWHRMKAAIKRLEELGI